MQQLVKQKPEIIRFGAVSGFNVVFHQLVLLLGQTMFDLSGVAANVVAATVTSIPAFFFARYWVWPESGTDWRRQVIPFWLIALAGLAVSTALVAIAERASDSTLVVQGASFLGYFIIWLVKFFILDRFVFQDNAQVDYEIVDCWNTEDLAQTES